MEASRSFSNVPTSILTCSSHRKDPRTIVRPGEVNIFREIEDLKIFEISANRLFITENMPTSATRKISSKCLNEAKETMPEVRICHILIEKKKLCPEN